MRHPEETKIRNAKAATWGSSARIQPGLACPVVVVVLTAVYFLSAKLSLAEGALCIEAKVIRGTRGRNACHLTRKKK